MPVHGRPFEKGNLYIHFNVIFPKSLSSPARAQLANLLPGGASSNGFMDTDNAEHVRGCPACTALCTTHEHSHIGITAATARGCSEAISCCTACACTCPAAWAMHGALLHGGMGPAAACPALAQLPGPRCTAQVHGPMTTTSC